MYALIPLTGITVIILTPVGFFLYTWFIFKTYDLTFFKCQEALCACEWHSFYHPALLGARTAALHELCHLDRTQ